MNVINFGNTFQIFEDDLKTYKKLPAKTYKVNFSKMMGFSLQKQDDFVQSEDKIYGDHERKVDKVLNSYDKFTRSLGVILSGDKGIGKSLFTQLLAQKSIEKGLPVILVDTSYPGIANFIDSIKQEALIMFDEFEKVFSNKDDEESQDKLLGLFDGTSQIKRLYTITVNDLNKVSSYMINRPGRFHYHIRFGYPDAQEVTEYMEDKLTEGHNYIKDVVAFSQKIKLNYDCLRAIVFELNLGSSFSEAIKDLNILRSSNEMYKLSFDILDAEGGLYATVVCKESMDLFSEEISITTWVQAKGKENKDDDYLQLKFNPSDINIIGDSMTLSGADVIIMLTMYSTDNKVVTDFTVNNFKIEKVMSNNLHYTV